MRPLPSSTLPIYYRRGDAWVKRMVRSNLFAWAVSIGLHGAVFGALYLAVFDEDDASKRIIIPEARLTGPADRTPPPTRIPLELSRQASARPLENTDAKLDELPLAAVTLDQVPAFAVPGAANADLASSLTAGALASSLGAGPVSSFFGQAGNAYKVVYVVDVSASLWIYIDEIAREMKRSIRDLVPTQRFHIVLARPQRVEELSSRRLVPAIRRYKEEAGAFLETITGRMEPGKADPVEAMRRAFAVEPELIYFLSDGDYRDVEQALEQTLRQLNADKAVKITVIGFGPSPRARALLERIARNHGGHFRAVEPR